MMDDEEMSENVTLLMDAISKTVYERPYWAGELVKAAIKGLEMRTYDARERAADMEAALVLVLSGGMLKSTKATVLEKIEKWEHRSALNWSRLKEKLK